MEKIAKPRYLKTEDEKIFYTMRQEIFKKIKDLEPKRKSILKIKAVTLPLIYLGLYLSALFFGANKWLLFSCYFLLGVMLVLLFLNLIHDSVHGVLFKSKKLNHLYVHIFDLMGANSYVWKMRHTRLHHNYPNVMGWDSDIEQSKLMRVFPHGGFSRIHKYQHIYMPFLYPFYLLNWLLVRDFKDFFDKNKAVWKVVNIPRAEFVKLFIFKAIFLFYILILPKLLLPISWGEMIAAFLIMMFTASILSLTVLLPPHANTGHDFPLPDESSQMKTSWFYHQLKHTNDVSHDNWFTRFFMGSFNYHVVHHLFPNISHVYYPEVTAIVAEESRKHNLPYQSYPLWTTLAKHYQLIKENRKPFNIFEETM